MTDLITMTRANFLREYEKNLKSTYAWAADAAKLERFMASCKNTVEGGVGWSHEGPAITAAWRAVGGKGKPTLKALRALP